MVGSEDADDADEGDACAPEVLPYRLPRPLPYSLSYRSYDEIRDDDNDDGEVLVAEFCDDEDDDDKSGDEDFRRRELVVEGESEVLAEDDVEDEVR